jgi:hypothetical protein
LDLGFIKSEVQSLEQICRGRPLQACRILFLISRNFAHATPVVIKSFGKPFETIPHRRYSKTRIQLQERPDGTRVGTPLLSVSTLNVLEVFREQQTQRS